MKQLSVEEAFLFRFHCIVHPDQVGSMPCSPQFFQLFRARGGAFTSNLARQCCSSRALLAAAQYGNSFDQSRSFYNAPYRSESFLASVWLKILDRHLFYGGLPSWCRNFEQV